MILWLAHLQLPAAPYLESFRFHCSYQYFSSAWQRSHRSVERAKFGPSAARRSANDPSHRTRTSEKQNRFVEYGSVMFWTVLVLIALKTRVQVIHIQATKLARWHLGSSHLSKIIIVAVNTAPLQHSKSCNPKHWMHIVRPPAVWTLQAQPIRAKSGNYKLEISAHFMFILTLCSLSN